MGLIVNELSLDISNQRQHALKTDLNSQNARAFLDAERLDSNVTKILPDQI